MGMIKCTECGKEMSDKASVCPNCGCPIEDIKAKLGEIEAEQEAKNKAKEAEKRAKEAAAEAKRQRQEEARKAATPAMKKKRIAIGAVMVILAVAVGICGWYFGIKIPHDQSYQAYLVAVQNYSEGIQQYNDAVNQYNEKAKEVISANDGFDEVIGTAQALVDCGDTPYEGAKITTLSNSIKDARNNKVSTPELKEVVASVQADPAMEKERKSNIDAAVSALESELESYINNVAVINSEKDSLSIPDYSAFINTLTIQSKELEDSYAIQRQITAPTEEWVITRLGRVADVANIDPVTEENDPNGNLNKPGGYTSTVYFGTALLGTQNLSGNPLIDEGTDAGGAVETYRTAEEAETRNNYLASFDGAGMFSSGSHMVLGTMVIRTSDDLKASQQETLTNAIIAAMTSLN